MKKSTKAIVISIVVLVCVGLGTIPFLTNTSKGSRVMDSKVIPPIDASAPEKTEAATFALG